MGLFDLFSRGARQHEPAQAAAPVPEGPDVPTPLSQERLIALFKEREYVYYVDSEGDLGGTWDDATFYFLVRGEHDEILNVVAQYPGTVDAQFLDQVREILEDSHRHRPWPKASYRIDDTGDIRVVASHTVDYEHGVTDAQIRQHVDCAISAVTRLFEALNQALGR